MSLPRYILGVDPGKKTGVALLDLLFEECTGVELEFYACCEYLDEIIAKYRPIVTCEQFIINMATVKNTQAPWSLEMIGVCRFLARRHGVPFILQPQSSAKRFATDERLKALGWYEKGKGHLRDGKRQSLLYVSNHGWWHDALSEHAYGTIEEQD